MVVTNWGGGKATGGGKINGKKRFVSRKVRRKIRDGSPLPFNMDFTSP